MSDDWYVYVAECGDGSLYTGVTTDVARRIAEHDAGRGAKYTRGRGPIQLRASRGPLTRTEAQRLEARIKTRPRGAKLAALEGT